MPNEPIFEGRVALLAGASSGINLAIARRLGQLGAKLAILSRTETKIHAAAAALTSEGFDVRPYAGDVRDAAAMEAIAAEAANVFGPFDIVVSGAAGNFFVPASEMSANAFKTIVDIDLIGTFNVFKAAHPHLRKSGASLVAITAPQGQRATRNQAHACAAKAGIDMLTKCLALEWGEQGIRVNAVSPGPIAGTEGLARMAVDEPLTDRIVGALALKRLGTGKDIADAVAFLCSDAASYITGTILDCDGGMRLGDLHVPEATAQ